MNKFKVGDRIERVAVSRTLVKGDVYVVRSLSYDGELSVEGKSSRYLPTYFKLAQSEEREEVENALAVMAKHEIRRFVSSAHNHDRGYRIKDRHFLCEKALLDHMFPKKNKELGALKKKQAELAEAIEALEKSL